MDMIVCRDGRHAQEVRSSSSKTPDVRIVSALSLMQLRGVTPRRIIVCEGVDLMRDVEGWGRLIDLLKGRQRAWGDRAEFIQL